MKTLLVTLFGVMALSVGSSQAANYILSGSMDVLQAGTNGGFGAGTGNGTGTILGSYDDNSNLLDYNISWQNLTSTVTNMHFHVGAPGVTGGVDFGIPSPWISPEIAIGALLDATDETNLLAGNWYVNVHTVNFGGGEIRGQVIVSPIPEPSRALLTLIGLVPFALRRRRS